MYIRVSVHTTMLSVTEAAPIKLDAEDMSSLVLFFGGGGGGGN